MRGGGRGLEGFRGYTEGGGLQFKRLISIIGRAYSHSLDFRVNLNSNRTDPFAGLCDVRQVLIRLYHMQARFHF